ncbi:MAG: glycosyltransferase family 2 protein [Muribaculaceae bacterium]|nr:glycosyltransferase family 2 protein [Muribaculaceae bacterium]
MISVIIPAYNSAKTLPKCIASVLGQTYKGEVEIIVIDDASTDETSQVAADTRVRYYRNPCNKGVFFGRTEGIRQARGERIMFIDSDDWLPSNAIELLASHDADIVCGDYVYRLTRLNLPHHFNRYELGGHITKQQIRERYIRSAFGDHSLIPVSMCAKLFRTSLFKNISFPDYPLFWGEDRIFLLYVLHNAEDMVCVPHTVYNYRWGGGTRRFNPQMIAQFSSWHRAITTSARDLGYHRHIAVANEELQSITDYFIRDGIMNSHPKEDIVALLVGHLGITTVEATARYEAQEQAIKKNWLKYFIKRII